MTEDSASPTRRTFLKTTVAAATITTTGIAGCLYPSGPEDTGAGTGNGGGIPGTGGQKHTAINPESYAGQFSQTINATDVGADPTGQTPINPILNSYAQPGNHLFFPPGEYIITGPHRIPSSGDIGITGQNAIIRHAPVSSISEHNASGEYNGDTKMFTAGSSGAPFDGFLLFGGFIFDFSAQNTGMQCLNAHCTGEAIVENIQVYGQQDLGTHGPFRLSTQSDESIMFIRGIDMRFGGKHYANTINTRTTDKSHGPNRPGPSWSTSGMTITNTQAGTMVVSNIACGAWPDNGLYLKGGEPNRGTVGRKIIRGCQVANANVSNIRTNDGPAWKPHPWFDGDGSTPADGYEHSVIEDCHVAVNNNYDPEIYGNQLGIRLDDGAPILRNTQVVLQQPNGDAIRVQDGASGAQIHNVRVDLYSPARGIVVAGSGNVNNSIVNTIGFTSSSAVAGAGNGVSVQQLSPQEIQAQAQQQQQQQQNAD